MGDIAKNVGEFRHGGLKILEWEILNVHHIEVNIQNPPFQNPESPISKTLYRS